MTDSNSTSILKFLGKLDDSKNYSSRFLICLKMMKLIFIHGKNGVKLIERDIQIFFQFWIIY